jgi:Flp pilus assembly pilin Flp
MRNFAVKFLRDEDGAITVDWVVLTAGMIGLAIGVVSTVIVATTQQSTSVGNVVADRADLLPD